MEHIDLALSRPFGDHFFAVVVHDQLQLSAGLAQANPAFEPLIPGDDPRTVGEVNIHSAADGVVRPIGVSGYDDTHTLILANATNGFFVI